MGGHACRGPSCHVGQRAALLRQPAVHRVCARGSSSPARGPRAGHREPGLSPAGCAVPALTPRRLPPSCAAGGAPHCRLARRLRPAEGAPGGRAGGGPASTCLIAAGGCRGQSIAHPAWLRCGPVSARYAAQARVPAGPKDRKHSLVCIDASACLDVALRARRLLLTVARPTLCECRPSCSPGWAGGCASTTKQVRGKRAPHAAAPAIRCTMWLAAPQWPEALRIAFPGQRLLRLPCQRLGKTADALHVPCCTVWAPSRPDRPRPALTPLAARCHPSAPADVLPCAVLLFGPPPAACAASPPAPAPGGSALGLQPCRGQEHSSCAAAIRQLAAQLVSKVRTPGRRGCAH